MAQKPRGYWVNFESIQRELAAFIAEQGTEGVMPTAEDLSAGGRRTLAVAIHRYHGGLPVVAQRLGLAITSKPKSYWKDFENIRAELLDFAAERGLWGIMPSEQALSDAGRRSLVVSIHKYHGGFPAVAHRLGLATQRDLIAMDLGRDHFAPQRQAGRTNHQPTAR